MRLIDLINDLELCLDPESEMLVEVGGVLHVIESIQDTSQGVILIVDKDCEERGMR